MLFIEVSTYMQSLKKEYKNLIYLLDYAGESRYLVVIKIFDYVYKVFDEMFGLKVVKLQLYLYINWLHPL